MPTPDATGSLNLSGTTGKVVLVSNTTLLTGTCPTGATIIDFVGYGSTASTTGFCFEGAGPTAAIRAGSGCTDMTNNSADFTTGAPTPRNTAKAAFSCTATPTAAEINVKQETTIYLTGSTYSSFASTAIGSTDTNVFTIENIGGTTLTISSIVAAGDFSVSGVPASVAANSTAMFSVVFSPTVAGTRTGTVLPSATATRAPTSST